MRTLTEEQQFEQLTTGYQPIDMSAHNSANINGQLYFYLETEEMYIHVNNISILGFSTPHVAPTAPRYRIHRHPLTKQPTVTRMS